MNFLLEEREKRKGRDDQCTICIYMEMSWLNPIICTINLLAINSCIAKVRIKTMNHF